MRKSTNQTRAKGRREARLPFGMRNEKQTVSTKLIKPKPNVAKEKKIRGPIRRTATVAGSWKHTPDTVKIRIETENRLPWSSPRSLSILVTEALEIRPLSSRSRLHSKPAIVHNLRSTFRLRILSCLSMSCMSSVGLLGTSEVFEAPSEATVPEDMVGKAMSIAEGCDLH